MAGEIEVNGQHVQLWDRNTIADGYKMAQNTIVPICSAITAGGAAVSAKIQEEIERATSAENDLQEQIDLINAATDVINVFGTYGEEGGFTEKSGYYFDPQYSATYHLTNNDIIKIINDEHTPVGDTENLTTGHQTYYQWVNYPSVTGDPTTTADGEWHFIGFTEPYYNTVEVDNLLDTAISNISSTISENYLSAKNAVHEGKNITVIEDSNNPEITIKTKDDVSFTNVSATNISANSLSATKLSANELSSTKLSANELSATTLSAATAYGQSAMFDDISATNLTALTASGNLAKFTTLSGNNIQGETSSINIDNLINSAVNGGALTGLGNIASIYTKNLFKGTTGKIDLHSSADKINIFLSGGIGNWLSLEAEEDTESGNHYIYLGAKDLQSDIDSRLLISDFSDWSGSTNSVFSGTSRSAQSAGSASLANSSTYTYSATTANRASTAGYAETANSAYSSQSSQNAAELGGVEAAKYMVSTKLYSNTAGVITAYGNSDSKSALGCVGDYLEKSAVNAGVGYGYTVTDSAFAQGVSNTAKSASLAQGIGNNAYNKSLAQGVDNTAENASVAQGNANSATNTAQAFGQGLQISGGMAIGKYNYSTDVAFVIGNGTSDSNRKDLLTVTHDGDLKIISAVGSVFQEAHISPSGVTYRSHGESQPGVTEEYASWHQILSTSGIPRAYASDFGQVLAVDSAANTLDWSDRYKLKKGTGAYDDYFETSQQIKRTDNRFTYIYIENTERRICLGVSDNGNVRLGEETGKTRSPTSAKTIIYSENTGDNTTYRFNGSAIGATNSDFAKTANSAYSAEYAHSAISSYYSTYTENSNSLGGRSYLEYALQSGTYTGTTGLNAKSAVNANNTLKWNGYELLLGTLPTQGQNQIAFI